ncbi:hypothetical protein PROFUN_16240, partial [Planoprotostelium fungivorum]
ILNTSLGERDGVRRREDVVTLHDCIQWLLQESVVAECPHEDLMAEAEEEGFSNYRVVNRHFQLNIQASTSPSPSMPPKAFETPAEDYQTEHRRRAFNVRGPEEGVPTLLHLPYIHWPIHSDIYDLTCKQKRQRKLLQVNFVVGSTSSQFKEGWRPISPSVSHNRQQHQGPNKNKEDANHYYHPQLFLFYESKEENDQRHDLNSVEPPVVPQIKRGLVLAEDIVHHLEVKKVAEILRHKGDICGGHEHMTTPEIEVRSGCPATSLSRGKHDDSSVDEQNSCGCHEIQIFDYEAVEGSQRSVTHIMTRGSHIPRFKAQCWEWFRQYILCDPDARYSQKIPKKNRWPLAARTKDIGEDCLWEVIDTELGLGLKRRGDKNWDQVKQALSGELLVVESKEAPRLIDREYRSLVAWRWYHTQDSHWNDFVIHVQSFAKAVDRTT